MQAPDPRNHVGQNPARVVQTRVGRNQAAQNQAAQRAAGQNPEGLKERQAQAAVPIRNQILSPVSQVEQLAEAQVFDEGPNPLCAKNHWQPQVVQCV